MFLSKSRLTIRVMSPQATEGFHSTRCRCHTDMESTRQIDEQSSDGRSRDSHDSRRQKFLIQQSRVAVKIGEQHVGLHFTILLQEYNNRKEERNPSD